MTNKQAAHTRPWSCRTEQKSANLRFNISVLQQEISFVDYDSSGKIIGSGSYWKEVPDVAETRGGE